MKCEIVSLEQRDFFFMFRSLVLCFDDAKHSESGFSAEQIKMVSITCTGEQILRLHKRFSSNEVKFTHINSLERETQLRVKHRPEEGEQNKGRGRRQKRDSTGRKANKKIKNQTNFQGNLMSQAAAIKHRIGFFFGSREHRVEPQRLLRKAGSKNIEKT